MSWIEKLVPAVPTGTVFTNPKEWLEYAKEIKRMAEELTGAAEIKREEKSQKRKLENDRYGCTCGDLFAGEAIGYKGYKSIVCLNCCDRCHRCHGAAVDTSYHLDEWRYSVCYGCFKGDNSIADSASECSDDDTEK